MFVQLIASWGQRKEPQRVLSLSHSLSLFLLGAVQGAITLSVRQPLPLLDFCAE